MSGKRSKKWLLVKIARLIVLSREEKEIVTTTDLLEILDGLVPEKRRNQFLSQVFQSIRIEVNQEIESLKQMLIDGVDLLNVGGRFVILSYHSLEDRVVKNLIMKGNMEGYLQKDFYGNPIKNYKVLNKKVIIPSDHELKNNPRARSARLRVAEKI